MKTAGEIRKIKDHWARSLAAQEALREVEPQEKSVRARRDLAALVLSAPYGRAAAESNKYRAEAKAAYEGYWSNPDGGMVATTQKSADRYSASNPGVAITYNPPTIDQVEYLERLEKARAMREKAFTEARERGEEILEPAEVYKTLGMHRNLMVRLEKRVNPAGLPALPDAMEVGKKAARELKPLVAKTTALREIRDDAIEALIADAVQSVDIAEHLGISPARVTQIRQGARR